MVTKDFIKLILGLAIIALGIWLIYYFWIDFLNILKGGIGLVVLFVGLILTIIASMDIKN